MGDILYIYNSLILNFTNGYRVQVVPLCILIWTILVGWCGSNRNSSKKRRVGSAPIWRASSIHGWIMFCSSYSRSRVTHAQGNNNADLTQSNLITDTTLEYKSSHISRLAESVFTMFVFQTNNFNSIWMSFVISSWSFANSNRKISSISCINKW